MKKYEFTCEEKQYGNILLKRIVAVKDFGDVKKDDLGGWIEKESNLSHGGDCWVYDEAKVYEDASVFEDAQISNKASVFGKAKVYGRAKVYCKADVYEDSKVYEDAQVFGCAEVLGNAEVYGKSLVFGKSFVLGQAQVFGKASIFGRAMVCGGAKVYLRAEVFGRAKLYGANEVAVKRITVLDHPLYYVTITDTHITIGCQNHPKEFWEKATYDDILEMDGIESAKAWLSLKSSILALANY